MTTENPTLKLTAGFERKQDLPGYNSATASAYVSTEIGDDDDAAAISKKLADAFDQVKAAVYDQLGIEVIMDDAGVIREAHIPVANVKASDVGEANLRRATQASGGYDTKGLEIANPDGMTQDIPQALADECARLGITKVWANTGKFGQFYKEHVAAGAEPKNPDPETGKPGIINYKK